MPVRVDRYCEPKLKEEIKKINQITTWWRGVPPALLFLLLPRKYSQVVYRGSCRDGIAIFRDNRKVGCSLPARVGVEVPVISVICKSSVVPYLLSYRFCKLCTGHVLDNLWYNIVIAALTSPCFAMYNFFAKSASYAVVDIGTYLILIFYILR